MNIVSKDEDLYDHIETVDDIINDIITERTRISSLNAYNVHTKLIKELMNVGLHFLLVAIVTSVVILLNITVLSIVIGGVVYAVIHSVLKHYNEKYHDSRLSKFMSREQKIEQSDDLENVYNYIDGSCECNIRRRYVLSLDELLMLRNVLENMDDINHAVKTF